MAVEVRGTARPDALVGTRSLPVSLTSFVGRERELEELRSALSRSRLLTLRGPGGCGKTRLALQLASNAELEFEDRVWWVDLAAVADESLVGAEIADALGIRPLPGMTEVQAACGYLANRHALVVLDNCEHLLAGCSEAVSALLQAAPQLVVLATSRAPLGVAGEADWAVTTLAPADALALFAERAISARSDLVLTDDCAQAAAALCRALDGLPLAIELAAARVRMLTVEQIAAAVADHVDVLANGPRAAHPRHRTLQASIEWSHDLLSVPERALFRRLSVFADGFSLAAARRICAGDGLDGARVLETLGALVDQSLVLADDRGSEVRYRLLQTVRDFGIEQLVAAGEERTIRDRHLDLFVDLAEEAEPHLESARQVEWVEALDPEAGNFATALDWAIATRPTAALRLCIALARWWSTRGRYAEAELATQRALDSCEAEPRLRARVLERQAFRAIYTGDRATTETAGSEALALAVQVADDTTAARARAEIGFSLANLDPRAARSELRRAAETARAAGDRWALVCAQRGIVMTYLAQGENLTAAKVDAEAAVLTEELGDPFFVGFRWFLAAMMAWEDGRFDDARAELARWPEHSGVVSETLVVAGLATLDVVAGHPERALARLDGQLARALEIGAGLAIPLIVHSTALAEFWAGRIETARGQLEGLLGIVEGRDARHTCLILCDLASAQFALGDEAEATATALRAQALAEQVGNRLLATRGRYILGWIAAARGDWSGAQQHALAHLDVCAEGGHAAWVPGCLDSLAAIAAELGADEDAVRLFAAADRARTEIGTVRFPPEQSRVAAIEARLEQSLGAETYTAARAQGTRLNVEEALEWARRARGPRRRPPGGWASLTPAEIRIAQLAADGLTNPEVAERMFISRATVKTHLAHIYRKLGVHNRAELTAQVVRQGDC